MLTLKKMDCVFVFFLVLSVLQGTFGATLSQRKNKPPFAFGDSLQKSSRNVAEKFIVQRLNNFNPQDTRKWKMRYFENDEFYEKGGPLFIFVGGEWEIDASNVLGGHLYDMGKELKAYLFYTEHRYYGKSHPTKNMSTENLRYLTTDQALADLAIFIQEMKDTIPGAKDSKVFLTGGSYSATMVTWFRQKYPHLAAGSWASSAPLLAKLDFKEFKTVATESIRLIGGDTCADRIEKAFRKMSEIIKNGNTEQLLKDFKLCPNVNFENYLDASHFFYTISDDITITVQYHRTMEINLMCRMITDESIKDDVTAVATFFTRGMTKCLDVTYKSLIEEFKKIEWNPNVGLQSKSLPDVRQWMYQACGAVGWFQTTGINENIFGTDVPPNFFVQFCKDIYDNVFNFNRIDKNVNRTNTVYGALKPEVTNVIFTHGQLDPWKAVGLQTDLNPNSPVIIIPLVSHVSDLGSISDKDSKEMKAAKKKVFKLVKKWVKTN